MWHFERVLVGPYKGAFTHPCFVRGNKALCASMSRHHLPSAEMYSQAFSAQTNQFILNQPSNQLVTDRTTTTDHQQHGTMKTALKSNDWDRVQQLISSIVPDYPSTTTNNTPAKTITNTSPRVEHIIITNNIMNSSSKVGSSSMARKAEQTDTKDLVSIDSEEDWSLLSDCLEIMLNSSSSVPNKVTTTPKATDHHHHHHHHHRYYPIDGLTTGMEEPASPEIVETLFAELSGW
jgi:hypothetical protein